WFTDASAYYGDVYVDGRNGVPSNLSLCRWRKVQDLSIHSSFLQITCPDIRESRIFFLEAHALRESLTSFHTCNLINASRGPHIWQNEAFDKPVVIISRFVRFNR